jgi:hypothetical protein
MAYEIPTAAEIYAHEHADGWVYDEQGYCPFTRARLETGLRLAFEAGAASVKAQEKPQTHDFRGNMFLQCQHPSCGQMLNAPIHQKAGK